MYSTDDLLFKFCEHLKVLNRSPATIEGYANETRHFLEAVDAKDVRQVTTSVIKAWIAGLYEYRTKENKPYSTSTICVKIRAVKRFFEYLESVNIAFIDPAEPIKEPQKVQRLKPTLSAQQINALLEQPNLATLLGIRDRAIMELFYSTGIRKAELCNLTIYDADLTGGLLRINQGKGKKDRVVPMGRHAVRYLREYITRVRPHYAKKHPANRYLMVDRSGRRMRRQTVRVMIRKYADQAGLKGNVGPHLFRHAFATALLKNGADIVAVQKMLGHTRIGTTQTYLRSLGLDMKKVHQKTHPREQDTISRKAIKPHITRRNPRE